MLIPPNLKISLGKNEKSADLEDRSRRKTIEKSGVYLNRCKARNSHILHVSCSIDRIHRVPKPSFLPSEVPRDIILQIHLFQVKEQLLAAYRCPDALSEQARKVQLLPDLSQFALQRCKNLISITKALRIQTNKIGDYTQWRYLLRYLS